MQPESLREKAIQAGFWSTAGSVGATLVSLAGFLVLSRILGPEVYGLMAMAEIWLAIGQKLLSSGLSEALIQTPRLRPEHSDTLFWTLQAAGAALAAALVAASGTLAGYFQHRELAALISAGSLALYFHACSLVPKALLARVFHFRAIAQAETLGEFLGASAGVALALSGHGVWSLVGQLWAASFFQLLILCVRARWRPRIRWSAGAFAHLWKFSLSRGLEGTLLLLEQQIPRILLGRVGGPVELGQFILARRIVENTTTLLNSPWKTAALSAFAAIQEDLERVRRVFQEGTRLTTALAFPACAGLVVLAPDLVAVLAGGRWAGAVVPLQILVLASLRQSFHVWNAALLRGIGKPEWLLGVSAVRTTATLTAVLFGLRWGAGGVCLAVLAGYYLSWPVATAMVRRATGLGALQQLKAAVPPLICAGLMAALLAAARLSMRPAWSPQASLALLVPLGVVCYGTCLYLLRRDRFEQLAHLLVSLPRPASRAGSRWA